MSERIEWTRDAVDRWLERLAPSTQVFCRAEVRAPWGFEVEARDHATFHIITDGEAWFRVDGADEPFPVERGDFLLLPKGAGHALSERPTSSTPPLETAVAEGHVDGLQVRFGGKGKQAEMVCGGCTLGVNVTMPETLLPPVLRSRLEPEMVEVVREESRRTSSGGEAVLSQLLTLLVLRALQAHLRERTPDELRMLSSPVVTRAVSFIHSHLDAPIEIADLCGAASVSSTVLHERFRETLGVAPIEYVRLLRLSRAKELVASTPLAIERIARQVGYRSASTLSRAFRREFGKPPGAFRRSA